MDRSLQGSSVYGIFQQEYWSQLLFPSPGRLPDTGIEPVSCTGRQILYHSVTWDLLSKNLIVTVIVVQSLSHVCLFVPQGTAACHVSLSFTISQILFKLMSIEFVMPPNHLILCHPLLLLPSTSPNIRVFSTELALCINGQSIGDSASISFLPTNMQGWFALRLTGMILQSKGFSRLFSNTTIQKHQFFSAQPSLQTNYPILTWLLVKS